MTALPLDKILPNPEQPRTRFDERELQGLADSIQQDGLINPIVVEAAGEQFILVDGERRVRAVQILGHPTIDAVIREASTDAGHARLISALVANAQRSDLAPIEQAQAFDILRRELGSAKAVARRLGLPPGNVILKLALLKMAPPVQLLFQEHRIPMDSTLIWQLGKLPPREQVRVSERAAAQGARGAELRQVVKHELEHRRPQNTARRSGRAPRVRAHPDFDVLALAVDWPRLPAPVISAARTTCHRCSLYPEASPAVCERCPLGDFLNCMLAEPGPEKRPGK